MKKNILSGMAALLLVMSMATGEWAEIELNNGQMYYSDKDSIDSLICYQWTSIENSPEILALFGEGGFIQNLLPIDFQGLTSYCYQNTGGNAYLDFDNLAKVLFYGAAQEPPAEQIELLGAESTGFESTQAYPSEIRTKTGQIVDKASFKATSVSQYDTKTSIKSSEVMGDAYIVTITYETLEKSLSQDKSWPGDMEIVSVEKPMIYWKERYINCRTQNLDAFCSRLRSEECFEVNETGHTVPKDCSNFKCGDNELMLYCQNEVVENLEQRARDIITQEKRAMSQAQAILDKDYSNELSGISGFSI